MDNSKTDEVFFPKKIRGTIYLLGEWGKDFVYKIGVTRGSIEKRIKKLQTGNSGDIYLLTKFASSHPFVLEKMLHNAFYANSIRGEWFEMKDERFEQQFLLKCEEFEKALECLEKNNIFFQKKYCNGSFTTGKETNQI